MRVRTTPVATIAVAALLAIGSAACVSAAPSVANSLQVMTWNVNTRNFAAHEWAGVIAEQAPDVVGLQEICTREAEDLQDVLRTEYGLAYELVPGAVRTSAALDYRDPGDWAFLFGSCRHWRAYGQALLTRLDVVEGTAVNNPLPGRTGPDEDEEPRGYMAVDLRTEGGHVRVYNTHLSTKGHARADQVSAIADDVRAHPRAVVMGDFNTVPTETQVLEPLLVDFVDVDSARNRPTSGNQLTDRETEPTGRKVDYIFLRGLTVVGEAATHWVASSDHRPLVANVR